MKTITANKKSKVIAPSEFQSMGIVAFQVVEFVINYFGSEVVTVHDTKIMEDGRQFVIGGCGLISEGCEVLAV